MCNVTALCSNYTNRAENVLEVNGPRHTVPGLAIQLIKGLNLNPCTPLLWVEKSLK